MDVLKYLFPFDKKLYKTIFFYTTVAFLIFFTLMAVFSAAMNSIASFLSDKFQIADYSLSNAGELTAKSQQLMPWALLVLFLVAVFILLQICSYYFFESKMWHAIMGRHSNLANANKFMFFSLLLCILLSLMFSALLIIFAPLKGILLTIASVLLVAAVLFALYAVNVGYYAFAKKFESESKTSLFAAVLAMLLLIIFMMFALLLKNFALFGFLVIVFAGIIVLLSVKKLLKAAVKHAALLFTVLKISINALPKTILPLIISIIMLVALNIIIWPFTFMPDIVATVVEAIVLIAYLAWFRLYLAHALHSVKF